MRGLTRVLLLYALACAFMYFAQDRLLFPVQSLHSPRAAELERLYPGSAWQLRAADGVMLRGWLDIPQGKPPLLLYLGGNGDEVSRWMALRKQLPGWAWATLNYRGYGASEGEPSEQALVADTLKAFDALAADPRIDTTRIVVIARSLGTGVAVQLAAQRPVAALILATPYDSIADVAAGRYPWLPVRWLLQHPFDSLAFAPSLQLPTLMLLAEHDETIRHPHSARLAAAWGGPYRLTTVPGTTHDDITWQPHFWQEVEDFLRRCCPEFNRP